MSHQTPLQAYSSVMWQAMTCWCEVLQSVAIHVKYIQFCFWFFLNIKPGLLVDSLAPNKSHAAKEQRPKAALRVQHAEIALHSSTAAEVNLHVLRRSRKSCFLLQLIWIEMLQFKVLDTARFSNFKQTGLETMHPLIAIVVTIVLVTYAGLYNRSVLPRWSQSRLVSRHRKICEVDLV